MILTKRMISFILLCMILIKLFSFMSSSDYNTSDSILSESISEQQNNVVSDLYNDYPAIIKEYRKFVECLLNEGIESVFENNIFYAPDSNLEYNWNCMLIEANIWSYRDYPKTKDAFGYALQDLNEDGSNELILLLKDYTVLAVFSSQNGKLKLMDAYWPRHKCAILDTGALYTLSSGGATEWYYSIHQISQYGNELIQIEKYGMTSIGEQLGYYKVVNGETYIIDEKEVIKFHERYPVLSHDREITKSSGIEFIQLF